MDDLKTLFRQLRGKFLGADGQAETQIDAELEDDFEPLLATVSTPASDREKEVEEAVPDEEVAEEAVERDVGDVPETRFVPASFVRDGRRMSGVCEATTRMPSSSLSESRRLIMPCHHSARSSWPMVWEGIRAVSWPAPSLCESPPTI